MLNSSLESQPDFVYDEAGKITGYKTKIGGADTVFPFNTLYKIVTDESKMLSDSVKSWTSTAWNSDEQFTYNNVQLIQTPNHLDVQNSDSNTHNVIIYAYCIGTRYDNIGIAESKANFKVSMTYKNGFFIIATLNEGEYIKCDLAGYRYSSYYMQAIIF